MGLCFTLRAGGAKTACRHKIDSSHVRRRLQATSPGEAAVISVSRARHRVQQHDHTPDSFVVTFAEGLSGKANLNDDELMATAGTERIESATEPARAAGEQEAWDWVSLQPM